VPQADGENAVISLAGRVAAATVKLCYRECVKNITVTVSDDVYREARIRAAEQDTSVSALVADYLRQLSEQAVEFTRLEAQQELVRRRIKRFSAGDRLGRDELHARAVR
jgi:cell division inhibitor SulA